MKMRAAVLEKFGEPLVVQDVDLGDPRDGEVLVKIHACGVCHTDLYTASGADPSGYVPLRPRPRGGRRRRDPGRGGSHAVSSPATTSSRCSHRSAVSASTARAARPTSALAIRETTRPRPPPGRHDSRLSRDGESMRHFMGTSTFAEYTVMPAIALANVSIRRPISRPCVCWPAVPRQGWRRRCGRPRSKPGRPAPSLAAGMVGLGAVRRVFKMQGAERIIAVDLSEKRLDLAKAGRRHRYDRSAATRTRSRSHSGDDRRLRLPTTPSRRPATGLGHGPGGRGRALWAGVICTVLGVAGKGERARRSCHALPDHRPHACRAAASAARKRPYATCRSSSTCTWTARSTWTASSRTASRSTRSTSGFELMEAQDGIRSVIELT